ncbi:DNA sulfur modification protein DndB [Candidatus Thiodiazotropha endoloripes]|uniref:DNA sulfur modification protein DndB n=1 Tax=Candidatus Thiodiazotropha endoloripes TaxID=1818881 RepID=UPI0009F39FB7|nr:DNA sulfur modification protein DndB [Candidatus Thiodiazotropha endoloripes]
MNDTGYSNTFPAIRGVQAGRPCYIAMCPMRIVPKLFKFDEEEVPAELRAQRVLNRSRIPEISTYLVDNARNYTLSSLTASVDAVVHFEPLADTGHGQNIGTLSIPMDAQILINDGQHRRAAIEEAIKENPELAHDNISVLFFIDQGLARSQQMFADLNKHAVRPSDSISTLYDQRDSLSDLARHVQKNVNVFSRLTEMEKSSISNRSTKLFTLSSIKNASKALLRKSPKELVSKDEKELAVAYWNEVAANMPDWQSALEKRVTTSELREQYVHAHGVMLQAMGSLGADLIQMKGTTWKRKLKKLSGIDWLRTNKVWMQRSMENGRISKARVKVVLTGNFIKQQLEVPLTHEEEGFEQEYAP